MDRILPSAIILAATVLVFAAMWWAWRGRARRAAGLRPRSDAVGLGEQQSELEVLYVATTRHGEPLERLAITGLAFRGKARLGLFDDGLTITVRGERDVVIDSATLKAAGVATWAIDRVVERDGLVFVSWTLGEHDVDSYFRIVDPQARERLIAAVERMTTASAAGAPSKEVED